MMGNWQLTLVRGGFHHLEDDGATSFATAFGLNGTIQWDHI